MSVLALMPLWVLVVVSLAAPTYFPSMTSAQWNVIGIDLTTVINGIALLWMLAGLAIVWRTHSEVVGSVALTIFTVPATVAVVFAPAAALILQN